MFPPTSFTSVRLSNQRRILTFQKGRKEYALTKKDRPQRNVTFGIVSACESLNIKRWPGTWPNESRPRRRFPAISRRWRKKSIQWRVTTFEKTVTYVLHAPQETESKERFNRDRKRSYISLVPETRSLVWLGRSHPLPPRERETVLRIVLIRGCQCDSLWRERGVARQRRGGTRDTGSRRRKDATRIVAAAAGWICRWRREMTRKNSCQTIWHHDSCGFSYRLPFSRDRHISRILRGRLSFRCHFLAQAPPRPLGFPKRSKLMNSFGYWMVHDVVRFAVVAKLTLWINLGVADSSLAMWFKGSSRGFEWLVKSKLMSSLNCEMFNDRCTMGRLLMFLNSYCMWQTFEFDSLEYEDWLLRFSRNLTILSIRLR